MQGFYAFVSGLRPRPAFEKPVFPQKLVESISTILGVETQMPLFTERG